MEEVKKIITAFALVALLVAGFLPATPAFAAAQYFSPSSGSHAVGSTFSVSVHASGIDQSVSAFSSYIKFPADKLSVTSLSKSGSVITVWVQEPTFSNTAGTVSFEGIIPNPGYSGTDAKLLTITFEVKAAGDATLSFTSASVLANDGYGTNITTGTSSASFVLTGESTGEPAPPAEEETPVAATSVPAAPRVTSSTHPDQTLWYANKNPSFSWPMPSGTTGVNVLADRNPTTDPGTRSDGIRSTYTYTDVDDGTWYFHIKLQNSLGWGATSHFAFQIDSVAPEPFTIELVDDPEAASLTPQLLFFATDALSGVEKYVIQVGEAEIAEVVAADIVQGTPYTLPELSPGEATVTVFAVDKAGNRTSASTSFTVAEPIAPSDSPLPGGESEEVVPEPVAVQRDWLDLFVRGVIYGVATLVVLLILIVLTFSIYYSLKHLQYHLQYAKNRHGVPRVRASLFAIRRDLARERERLERNKKIKMLPADAETIVKNTLKTLKALDRSLAKDIDALSNEREPLPSVSKKAKAKAKENVTPEEIPDYAPDPEMAH